MVSNAQKRILIAPLDWGLGHTTRCVPLVQWQLENDCQPVFAGNDWQRHYISETFPGIETIHLDGYNVVYGKNKSAFMFSLMMQLPKLAKTVRREYHWLQEKIKTLNINGIISDNRYGLYHETLPSVFITHQLQVQTGLGALVDNVFQKLHYRFIRRFNACWVPDVGSNINLSGKLGHPDQFPPNTKYLGLLSQLATRKQATEKHILVLLSGPEPQRTILSSLLWKLFAAHPSPVVFVEGSNDAATPSSIPAHITYYKRLTGKELLPLLQNAAMVYCRSGYSTLMDLVALGKKAVVIPTPGQTEQEYLAKHLHEQGIFYRLPQNDINQAHFNRLAHFPFKPMPLQHSSRQYEPILAEWIKNL